MICSHKKAIMLKYGKDADEKTVVSVVIFGVLRDL